MAGWSTGLFDCFSDCGICFYGWCCPACLYGENAEKIDGSSCIGQCCAWSILSGCSLCCLVHMNKRETLRLRFGLQEDCNDCIATTFCATCAICQEARELKYRGAALAVAVPVLVQPMAENTYPPMQQMGGNMYPPVQPMGGNMYPQVQPMGGDMYPPVQPMYAPAPPAYSENKSYI